MSYQFTPMNEEELEASGLLEPGDYDFEVTRSTRKISKSGNSMAELQLKVWDKEGKTHTIFDYLVFSTVSLNIRKVKHFCDSVGLEKEYQMGNLSEDLGGYSGMVKIDIQEAQPKQNGGFYAKKSIVEDYLVKKEKSSDVPIDKKFDDDVPF